MRRQHINAHLRRPPKHFFKTPANNNTIKARQHNIQMSLATGDILVESVHMTQWDYPPWAPDQETPEFDKMLEKVFRLCSDPEDMTRHFWEFLGYLLLPSDVCKIHWVMFGTDRSGKFEVLRAISPLIGKREPVDALVFADGYLDAYYTDDAMNYTMIIPFFDNFPPDDVNPFQMSKIALQEMSGIFTKAVFALQRCIRRGEFSQPRDCHDAYKEYFRMTDQAGRFIEECCIVDETLTLAENLEDVYQRYREWTGPSRNRLTSVDIVNELSSRGIIYRFGLNRKKAFYGIKLKPH